MNIVTKGFPEMQMARQLITPAMASEWLDTVNTANRSLSHHTVTRYASDMASGNWMDTHQNSIAFYRDGTLADGQHRLAAVVKAGVPVAMFIARGLDKSAISAIDQGRTRTMADVMSMSGVLLDGKYSTATCAMMNVIRRAEGRTMGVPTAHEMSRAINRMYDGINFAHGVMSNSQGTIRNSAIRAAIATSYYHCDRRSLERFCDVLCTGMPVTEIDATVIAIRNRILVGKAISGSNGRVDMYKTVLRFIRSHEQGKVLVLAKSGAELVYRTGAFDE